MSLTRGKTVTPLCRTPKQTGPKMPRLKPTISGLAEPILDIAPSTCDTTLILRTKRGTV